MTMSTVSDFAKISSNAARLVTGRPDAAFLDRSMLSGKLLKVCDNCIKHYDASEEFWHRTNVFLCRHFTVEEGLLCYNVLSNILLGGVPV